MSEKEAGGLEMIRTLVGVAAISGMLIVTAFRTTEPIIKKNKAAYLKKAVFEVIPGAVKVVTYSPGPDGALAPARADEEVGTRFHAGYGEDGALAGVAVQAAGQGFADIISFLYGYSPVRQTIVGFKVLESKETPGLGDKIGVDPAFLANFSALDVRLAEGGRSLAHPITVVKNGQKAQGWEIDAITGATISSKAVGRILDVSASESLPVLASNLGALQGGG